MNSHFETTPGNEKPDLFKDGLHLTAEGFEVWFEAMEPLFKKLYEK
jgi:lysophospholipase L1-like esterase